MNSLEIFNHIQDRINRGITASEYFGASDKAKSLAIRYGRGTCFYDDVELTHHIDKAFDNNIPENKVVELLASMTDENYKDKVAMLKRLGTFKLV